MAELDGLPPDRRTARYVCVLALALPAVPGGSRSRLEVITRRGTSRGRIALAPKGAGGFGYDPIFEPSAELPGGRTFGEYDAAEKNRISHRARAARRMAKVLRERAF
jgi:XTP/dITP diphosphohydrolase